MSKRSRTPRWAPGRLFAVPLDGGDFGLCQSLSSLWPNVLDCVFLDARFEEVPSGLSDTRQFSPVAVLATWKKVIDKRLWRHVGEAAFAFSPEDSPNHKVMIEARGVGLKTYDAEIIEEFLSAYHGKVPWNIWKEPDYLDRMLLSGVPRPSAAVVLSDADRSAYRREHGWE